MVVSQKNIFRYLSFSSNHPTCHKIGTIFGLVDRAILLSNSFFYKKNLELVIEISLNNMVPLKMIFDHINKRIKNLAVNRIFLAIESNNSNMKMKRQ